MKKIICLLTAGVLLFIAGSCTQQPGEISIVPMPNDITVNDGAFKVAGAKVYAAPELDKEAREWVMDFATKLTTVTGRASHYSETPVKKGICFLSDSGLDPEAYTIDVSKKLVVVKASTAAGVRFATQTIGQMLPPEYFGKAKASKAAWVLPCVSIKDSPRFGYRGLMLDVCRHFFSVEEVKRYLDLMAIYKMNTFHWHLSEDQGWRIEIKKYPKLTEIGAWRDSTKIGANNDAKAGYDHTRYGGFYTQDQIRDVVAYAQKLGITVMPEIDLPGHMVAALASYPELGCTGGPYSVRSRWGIATEVLCPGKETTFKFIEDVLTEVMELFPGKYIDIGGDECPKAEWKKCPDCQRRIRQLGLRDKDGLTAEQQLQNYVTARVQKFVNDHGRKIVGWDEILEGDLAEGATVMSWRGVKGGVEAAKRGFDVIMSPNTYMYIDYYQTKDKEREPLCIGGYLPVDTTYVCEPYKGIPAEAQKHILGVQANLWTEYISTNDHLEYQLLPRAAALSEVQWCNPSNKDFDRFKAAMPHQAAIYDVLDMKYCKVILGEPAGIEGYEGLLANYRDTRK